MTPDRSKFVQMWADRMGVPFDVVKALWRGLNRTIGMMEGEDGYDPRRAIEVRWLVQGHCVDLAIHPKVTYDRRDTLLAEAAVLLEQHRYDESGEFNDDEVIAWCERYRALSREAEDS